MTDWVRALLRSHHELEEQPPPDFDGGARRAACSVEPGTAGGLPVRVLIPGEA